MIVTTTHAPGTFCWPELATSDQAGAEKFYGALFGWTVEKSPMGPDAHYTIFQLNGVPVAAGATMQPEQKAQGIPPHWLSYVATADVDASLAKAKGLGGTALAGPFDVMEHGRMAILADPTGGVFALWQARQHSGVGVLDETHALVWTELATDDPKKAGAFYEALLGWKGEAYPGMDYTVMKRGDAMVAGVMPKTPEMGPMPTQWMPYIGVDDCAATLAKAESLGGKAIAGPIPVPGVGLMGCITDPQGAHISLMQFTGQGG